MNIAVPLPSQIEKDVEQLKLEFELQKSIKPVTQNVSLKIQQQRDKISEIMGKIQQKRQALAHQIDQVSTTDTNDEQVEEFIQQRRKERQSEKEQEEKKKIQESKEAVSNVKIGEILKERTYVYRYFKFKQEKSRSQTPEKGRSKEKNQVVDFRDIQENEHITVPRSFSFEHREKKQTRREQWVKALVEEKQRELDEATRYQPFKAHDIPYSVLDKDLYNRMVQEQEERSRLNRETSQKRTSEISKPFSFYERDQEKKNKIKKTVEEYLLEKDKELQHKFQAKPVPWYCLVEHFDRKQQEQKEQSEMRRKIRMQWLMSNSSLPPRMQEHLETQRLKQYEQEMEKRQKTFTFSPKKHKKVPNFQILHKLWEQKLQESRRQKQATKPRSPRFHQSHKVNDKLTYLDSQMETRREDPIKQAKRALRKKPKKVPASTKKFEAMVERIKQEREIRGILKQRELDEEQQRFEKKQLFVPRVQSSWAIADHRQIHEELRQQKLINFYVQQKQQEEEFNEMMKDIFLRVYQRPLLMEQASSQYQEEEMEEQPQQQQDYYNEMNPIGEDEEIEYMKQQAQEQEDEEQVYAYKQQQHRGIDPEGVDDVGDEAEQSHEEVEFANEDYNEEYIDMDNISPELLEQLQQQALGSTTSIFKEQGYDLRELANYQYEEGDEDQDQEQEDEEDDQGYMGQHHHSF